MTLVYGSRLRIFCPNCDKEIDLPSDAPRLGDQVTGGFRDRVFDTIHRVAIAHRYICKPKKQGFGD